MYSWDAVTALTVAPEDWIKTLALLMWLEYNLLQESTATICLALYTSWLKVIICGQFG
jgi:hypothetical protein